METLLMASEKFVEAYVTVIVSFLYISTVNSKEFDMVILSLV